MSTTYKPTPTRAKLIRLNLAKLRKNNTDPTQLIMTARRGVGLGLTTPHKEKMIYGRNRVSYLSFLLEIGMNQKEVNELASLLPDNGNKETPIINTGAFISNFALSSTHRKVLTRFVNFLVARYETNLGWNPAQVNGPANYTAQKAKLELGELLTGDGGTTNLAMEQLWIKYMLPFVKGCPYTRSWKLIPVNTHRAAEHLARCAQDMKEEDRIYGE